MSRARSLPNLSEAQERSVWHLLKLAWSRVGAEVMRQVPPGTSENAARQAWRRTVLHEETGLLSLRELPRAGGALVRLLARLERDAQSGIAWQMRLRGAEARPGRHELRAVLERLGIADRYAQGVARNVLNLGADAAVDLDALDAAQAAKLVRFFHANGQRIAKAAEARAT